MFTVLANAQYHINDQVLWEVTMVQMMIVIAVVQGGQEEVEMEASARV